MTVPAESLGDVGDGIWASMLDRGVGEGSEQQLHVSWRCPTLAAAEQLEEALRADGITPSAAQPNAEAGGAGYGVAATVSFIASRAGVDDVLDRMVRLGASYGAMVAGVGTMFRD